jgi:hypothetical protein
MTSAIVKRLDKCNSNQIDTIGAKEELAEADAALTPLVSA